jgi:RimJ/RimL family protein N-acetyltransferase
MSTGREAYSIRALSSDDWQIFASLRLEALQKYPQYFGSIYANELQNRQADWQRWLGHSDGCVFALFYNDEIVGITGVRADKDDPTAGFLIASYIKHEHQGKGLSEKLYEARIRWALAFSLWRRLIVAHRKSNNASRRAIQRHGFKYTHQIAKLWPDGTSEDEICYELDLEQLRQKQ